MIPEDGPDQSSLRPRGIMSSSMRKASAGASSVRRGGGGPPDRPSTGTGAAGGSSGVGGSMHNGGVNSSSHGMELSGLTLKVTLLCCVTSFVQSLAQLHYLKDLQPLVLCFKFWTWDLRPWVLHLHVGPTLKVLLFSCCLHSWGLTRRDPMLMFLFEDLTLKVFRVRSWDGFIFYHDLTSDTCWISKKCHRFLR